jgi:hypothetical protein
MIFAILTESSNENKEWDIDHDHVVTTTNPTMVGNVTKQIEGLQGGQ